MRSALLMAQQGWLTLMTLWTCFLWLRQPWMVCNHISCMLNSCMHHSAKPKYWYVLHAVDIKGPSVPGVLCRRVANTSVSGVCCGSWCCRDGNSSD